MGEVITQISNIVETKPIIVALFILGVLIKFILIARQSEIHKLNNKPGHFIEGFYIFLMLSSVVLFFCIIFALIQEFFVLTQFYRPFMFFVYTLPLIFMGIFEKELHPNIDEGEVFIFSLALTGFIFISAYHPVLLIISMLITLINFANVIFDLDQNPLVRFVLYIFYMLSFLALGIFYAENIIDTDSILGFTNLPLGISAVIIGTIFASFTAYILSLASFLPKKTDSSASYNKRAKETRELYAAKFNPHRNAIFFNT